MASDKKSLIYWLDKYKDKFSDDFPIVIGWEGDRIAEIQKCLKSGKPVDVKKMESEIDHSVIY